MPTVPVASAEAIGFDPRRLERAYGLIQRWVDTDRVPAATLCVGRRGRMVAPRFFGRQRPEASAPALRDDSLFLVASITKPVTATAAMLLVERGQVALQDRVADFVPDFAQNDKQEVRLLHLPEVVGPTETPATTLITCGGEFDYVNGEYLSRMVVRATLVETISTPQASPPAS
jgi:hypothetical protein